MSQTLTVLRSFLLSIMPIGTEVLQGLDNRVPEPASEDFVLMTEILRERLATNEVSYDDGFPASAQKRHAMQSTRLTVQLDVHGPNSSANAQIISTLFRDEYAADQFEASGYALAPLYTSEPRQLPFHNAEHQIERRWSIDALIQVKPIVTSGQDFADALSINPLGAVTNVDSTYPPA